MRINRVKKLWREGKTAVGGFLSIPHVLSAETMAHTGLDWLCIDMQHGCIDYSDAVPMLAAISTTAVTPFVRVPWNEPSVIMKVLDAGAYGVIVPMVSNRAEAERAVAACRYPPKGIRSNGPNRAALYGGADYQKHADNEMLCIVMIETAEGIENFHDHRRLVPRHAHERRDIGGGYRSQHRHHIRVVDAAVLHVDAQPVEPGMGHHLGLHAVRD